MVTLLAIDNKFANTRAVSVGELLTQQRTLKVPRFQRNYDWNKERVGMLWKDMVENFDQVRNISSPVQDAQYLLGPVVLVNKNDTFFVIDGQQRLATLTMLFCVARDIMFEYNATEGVGKLNQLLANDFMGKCNGWKLELNDTDKKLFKEIQEHEPDDDSQIERFKGRKYKTKSKNLLLENYRFLHERLLQFLDQDEQGDLKAENDDEKEDRTATREHRQKNIPMMSHFIDFVCYYNYVVMVMVSDDNAAFQIFETLNYRGKPLSKSNLIKNHILNQINEEEIQMEQSNRWDNIFDEVVGTDQQDDDFIMESYNSRYADKGSIRFEYSGNLQMSKKNLYAIIRDIVTTGKSCKKLIDELEEDAEFLSMLNEPSKYIDESSKDDIDALKALKAKFIRVPLLAAYRKWYEDNPKDYSALVGFLVKFFFKIRVVRQVHPGKVEKISTSAVQMINDGKSYQEVISELGKHDDHADFMYNFENKFVQEPQKDAAKYVLRKITLHLGTLPYEDVRPIDVLSLEHILPQKHDKWSSEDFFDVANTTNQLDEFVGRLGNLTLLNQAVNTKIQNELFETKKNYCDKDGTQIGYKCSKLEINTKTVCNYDKWTASIIEEREKKFKEYADTIWKLDK